jgi:tetrahydromethanopterin S-methyltransferase subunit G
MTDRPPNRAPSISELPHDELIAYGCSLGLSLGPDTPTGEALRLIRKRQELLIDLDRDALLDIVRWLRLPVRRSVGKEQLSQLISERHPTRFDGLSDKGLDALAKLNDVLPTSDEPRAALEKRLRKAGGLGGAFQRFRRKAVAAAVSRAMSQSAHAQGEYQFLPEDDAQSLRNDIERSGLVGGVAKRIRGYADEYVHEKLDEIERRIDRKLDEIDTRLGEWRDREVKHRLRILKLTLLFSILVALISLLYDYLVRT